MRLIFPKEGDRVLQVSDRALASSKMLSDAAELGGSSDELHINEFDSKPIEAVLLLADKDQDEDLTARLAKLTIVDPSLDPAAPEAHSSSSSGPLVVSGEDLRDACGFLNNAEVLQIIRIHGIAPPQSPKPSVSPLEVPGLDGVPPGLPTYEAVKAVLPKDWRDDDGPLPLVPLFEDGNLALVEPSGWSVPCPLEDGKPALPEVAGLPQRPVASSGLPVVPTQAHFDEQFWSALGTELKELAWYDPSKPKQPGFVCAGGRVLAALQVPVLAEDPGESGLGPALHKELFEEVFKQEIMRREDTGNGGGALVQAQAQGGDLFERWRASSQIGALGALWGRGSFVVDPDWVRTKKNLEAARGIEHDPRLDVSATDIDLFLVAPPDASHAHLVKFLDEQMQLATELLTTHNVDGRDPEGQRAMLFRTDSERAVTLQAWGRLTLQFILVRYPSPAHVVTNFDVDCCCVVYDAKTTWANYRGIRSLATGYDLIDPRFNSKDFAKRIMKYARRGFRPLDLGLRVGQALKPSEALEKVMSVAAEPLDRLVTHGQCLRANEVTPEMEAMGLVLLLSDRHEVEAFLQGGGEALSGSGPTSLDALKFKTSLLIAAFNFASFAYGAAPAPALKVYTLKETGGWLNEVRPPSMGTPTEPGKERILPHTTQLTVPRDPAAWYTWVFGL